MPTKKASKDTHDLVLFDEEAAQEGDTALRKKLQRASIDVLYWKSKYEKSEAVGRMDNLYSLTAALERVKKVAGEYKGREMDLEEQARLLGRFMDYCQTAIDAVWGAKNEEVGV